MQPSVKLQHERIDDVAALSAWLCDSGLDGLEVIDPDATPDYAERAKRLFERDGFVCVKALGAEQNAALHARVEQNLREIFLSGGDGGSVDPNMGAKGAWRYAFGSLSKTGSCLHLPEWAALLLLALAVLGCLCSRRCNRARLRFDRFFASKVAEAARQPDAAWPDSGHVAVHFHPGPPQDVRERHGGISRPAPIANHAGAPAPAAAGHLANGAPGLAFVFNSTWGTPMSTRPPGNVHKLE